MIRPNKIRMNIVEIYEGKLVELVFLPIRMNFILFDGALRTEYFYSFTFFFGIYYVCRDKNTSCYR